MYQEINTINDVIRERYLYGSELDGKYGFPKLPTVNADLTGVKAVPFNLAQRELNPRNSVCHFFIDDHRFERLWNNPEKYFRILENFRYVCTPDFSFYDGMPLAMKIGRFTGPGRLAGGSMLMALKRSLRLVGAARIALIFALKV